MQHSSVAEAIANCTQAPSACLVVDGGNLSVLAASAAYGQTIHHLFPAESLREDRVARLLRKVAASGVPEEITMENSVRVHCAPVLGDGRVGALFVWLDGTRVADDEVRLEAGKALAAKSRFLAAASHDLRQPFQAMRFFHSVLSSHAKAPAARRAADLLGKALTSGEQLLGALLDISTLDAGTVQAKPHAFDVAQLAERVAAEFRPQAQAKHLSFRLYAPARVVHSDPILVERIIRNLVANAIHYTRNGGVLLAVRRRGNCARIEVWDTGFGIPEDQLSTVFEEFHQLENPGRDRAQGLGLGLAIVQRLSRLLDAPVEVKSRLGVGTMFSVALPIASQRPVPVGDSNRKESVEVEKRTILVVEDDAMVLTGLQMILETWGLDVLAAEDMAQVLQRIDQARPSLILSDLRLREGLTGFDVVERVRAILGAEVPAIILTGETGKTELAEGQRRNLTFLHKPIQAEPLKQAIVRAAGA